MVKYISPAIALKKVRPGFLKVICSDDNMPRLLNAMKNIDSENISPREDQIFNFARYCDLQDIKVVILGQDPYPNPKHAHGLSFSSLDKKIPQSLKNIFKSLINSGLMDKMPNNPNLVTWAKQGVLMMNVGLTTRKGKRGSHIKLWRPITIDIIKLISRLNQPVCFMLWGAYAQDLEKHISLENGSIILKSAHPSPMSQNRLADPDKFINCCHFEMANEFLKNNGVRPIEWNTNNMSHVVYTDGSTTDNGKSTAKGGYCAHFASGPLKNLQLYGKLTSVPRYGLIFREVQWPTNIRSEGMAIIMALERIISFGHWDDVTVVTDCKFWINVFNEWYDDWVRSPTDLLSRKNSDLLERVGRIKKIMGDSLVIDHVYSHTGSGDFDSVMNELCDKYAKMARDQRDYGDMERYIPTPKKTVI